LFGVLHGREAVLRQIAEFADPFEGWQVVAEELIDAGDEVVGRDASAWEREGERG